MSTPDADDVDAETFGADPAVTADPQRATRLDAALEHAQREERSDLADDIARQQATDDRIVDALTKTQPPAAEAPGSLA